MKFLLHNQRKPHITYAAVVIEVQINRITYVLVVETGLLTAVNETWKQWLHLAPVAGYSSWK